MAFQSLKLNEVFMRIWRRIQGSMKEKIDLNFFLFWCFNIWIIYLNFRESTKNHDLVLQWVVYYPSYVYLISCPSFSMAFGKYTRGVFRTLSNTNMKRFGKTVFLEKYSSRFDRVLNTRKYGSTLWWLFRKLPRVLLLFIKIWYLSNVLLEKSEKYFIKTFWLSYQNVAC